jgi:hypothetical protein
MFDHAASGSSLDDLSQTVELLSGVGVWIRCTAPVRLRIVDRGHTKKCSTGSLASEALRRYLLSPCRHNFIIPTLFNFGSDLICAVNVPYGHNPLSISSYFYNLRNTFRASVFCG